MYFRLHRVALEVKLRLSNDACVNKSFRAGRQFAATDFGVCPQTLSDGLESSATVRLPT